MHADVQAVPRGSPPPAQFAQGTCPRGTMLRRRAPSACSVGVLRPGPPCDAGRAEGERACQGRRRVENQERRLRAAARCAGLQVTARPLPAVHRRRGRSSAPLGPAQSFAQHSTQRAHGSRAARKRRRAVVFPHVDDRLLARHDTWHTTDTSTPGTQWTTAHVAYNGQQHTWHTADDSTRGTQPTALHAAYHRRRARGVRPAGSARVAPLLGGRPRARTSTR